MRSLRYRFFAPVLFLLMITSVSCSQNRTDKTKAIIEKLNLIEGQKLRYEFQIKELKYQVSGPDSIKLIELEQQLSNDAILQKVCLAFDEIYSNEEIETIYAFMQTSAFKKLINGSEMHKAISVHFNALDEEIERIKNNFEEQVVMPKVKIFEPIPVDRPNGFYATVNYKYNCADKDVQLEEIPSITTKDILEVKKTYRSSDNQPEISIVLTKEGARKFYILTKENINKPIPIVIDKRIVSMPMVNMAIMGGKASISGNFSEVELDKMIELLKKN